MRACRGSMVAILSLAVASIAGARSAAGQAADSAAGCGYRECALGIAPRWNGLALVRGVRGEPVANLGFFWPRDVSATLRGAEATAPGADAAVREARRALRLRRIGALLTDAGGVAIAVAAARAARSGGGRPTALLAGGGGLALVLSVPFQFAADGALSRAVWWHNQRYARRAARTPAAARTLGRPEGSAGADAD